MTLDPKFENTRKALVEFDADAKTRQMNWCLIETQEDVIECEARDARALRKVQEAFYKDTSDINRLENCYLVGIKFMREVAFREV